MTCYCKSLSEHINTGVEGSSEIFNTKPGVVSCDSNLCFLRFALYVHVHLFYKYTMCNFI